MQLPAFLNKERVVFLAAAMIFLIGVATMLTRTPLAREVPTVPPAPGPASGVEVRSLVPLFADAAPEYTRSNPFSLREVWGPPKPGRLPDLPPPAAGYAVPRVTLEGGIRPDAFAIQVRPPAEVVEAVPDGEGVEGEGAEEEGVEEPEETGEAGG